MIACGAERKEAHVDTLSLSSLLSALFDRQHTAEEAYTLIKREAITPLIIDGRLRMATPKALSFYGLTEQDLAAGAWQSLCQPFDEFNYSRIMAMARHHDHPIPTRYISRIQKPDGSIVNVVKDTREIIIEGVSHWLTHLLLAADEPDLPTTADIAASLPVDRYRDFGGIFSLAEVYEAIGVNRNFLHNWHSPSNIGQIMPLNQERFVLKKRSKLGTELAFGQPVNIIANGQIVFECQVCGQVWLARKLKTETGEVWDRRLSQRCSNSETRCYDWFGDYSREEALAMLLL